MNEIDNIHSYYLKWKQVCDNYNTSDMKPRWKYKEAKSVFKEFGLRYYIDINFNLICSACNDIQMK
jgi:hypothetical protein